MGGNDLFVHFLGGFLTFYTFVVNFLLFPMI